MSTQPAGPPRTHSKPGVGAWFDTHRTQALAGGAGLVVLYALYRSRKNAAAGAGGAVVPSSSLSGQPSANGGSPYGPYNSTANDVYSQIEPYLETLNGKIGALQAAQSGATGTATVNPVTGTTSSSPAGSAPAAAPPALVGNTGLSGSAAYQLGVRRGYANLENHLPASERSFASRITGIGAGANVPGTLAGSAAAQAAYESGVQAGYANLVGHLPASQRAAAAQIAGLRTGNAGTVNVNATAPRPAPNTKH